MSSTSSVSSPVTNALEDAVAALKAGGLHVYESGLSSKEEPGSAPLKLDGNPRLRLLLSIIPLILKPSERKSVGSYGAKHVLERLLSCGYISNGECIVAAVALGYKWRHVGGSSPNVVIYGSWTWEGDLPFRFDCV